jgi:hypothetical protein
MFTRTIFIQPDSDLIWESVCTYAKLFVDEGNVHMAQVESWKNKNIDFSWKKEYIKNYDAILLSKYDSAEKIY